nr:MAG: hypothetical protein [Bacteriophage sp.]
MAKDWGDRWGDEALERGSKRFQRKVLSVWDENGNFIPKEKRNPMYISDGTRAIKITQELLDKLKTRVLIGNMGKFKVSNQSMYYTAQLPKDHYVDSINISGKVLKAKAVMPFRGVWEFSVV